MKSSFESALSYARVLVDTPKRLTKRALAVSSANEEIEAARTRSGIEMQRQLLWWDVVGLGVGGMVGAGVFVSTGQAARLLAGPAVVLSYAVAGVVALLSAFCYADFAVDLPAAGGAFSYVRSTLGELPAYLTGVNLVMEYVISNAAVARSFTSYLAAAVGGAGERPDQWLIQVTWLPSDFDKLDFPAAALVALVTMCICRSTKSSCTFNGIVTLFHLALIAFIIAAGFVEGSLTNLYRPAGFTPYGLRGVVSGAAFVFFSYIGYDSVSTLAEETHNPAKTIPLGILGSVIIVAVLYCLMAAALVMLVPFDQIDVSAPFALAFKGKTGWPWAANLVALCACVGIWSSLVLAILGQARYMCVIGRSKMVPLWFARVSTTTGTPINASVCLGACTAAMALFTDVDVLIDLVSIGTLFVFYLVANALIVKRYTVCGETISWATLGLLVVVSGVALALVTLWQLQIRGLSVCVAIITACTAAFKLAVPPVKREGGGWKSYVMPFPEVASVVLNVFLAGMLKLEAFKRFGEWNAGALIFYMMYSVHAADEDEERVNVADVAYEHGTPEGGG